MKISLGWTLLNKDGTPYKPMKGQEWYARRKPITVYKSKAVALSANSVKDDSLIAVEVFYEG